MIQRIDLRLSAHHSDLLEDGTVDCADISIEVQDDSLVIMDDDGVERFGVFFSDGALRVVAWSHDSGEVVHELESRIDQ
tara:strand:- start:2086 stop:2322 length:237 start_codon:yes stop_codon:yes gene_type:complete